MNERILIKGEKYKFGWSFFKVIFIIAVVMALVLTLTAIISAAVDFSDHMHTALCLTDVYYAMWERGENINITEVEVLDCEYAFSNGFSYAMNEVFSEGSGEVFWIPIAIVMAAAVAAAVIFVILNSYELTVTDKIVYGKVFYLLGAKDVALPVNKLTAVSKSRFLIFFKGISVSTPSGRIAFGAIKNNDEIFKVITRLMIDGQCVEDDCTDEE